VVKRASSSCYWFRCLKPGSILAECNFCVESARTGSDSTHSVRSPTDWLGLHTVRAECTRSPLDSTQSMRSAHGLRAESAQSVRSAQGPMGHCKLLYFLYMFCCFLWRVSVKWSGRPVLKRFPRSAIDPSDDVWRFWCFDGLFCQTGSDCRQRQHWNRVVINDTDLVDVLFKWRGSERIRFSNILGLRVI